METQYKHLSVEERNTLHRGRLAGQSLRAIARSLGRPVSTISREVARYGSQVAYDALSAQQGYRRRRRQGQRKLAPGSALWNAVVMDLYRGVAGTKRGETADDVPRRSSPKGQP